MGVDVKPQPRYPFPFIQADVMSMELHDVPADVIHASPPCQVYSASRSRPKSNRPYLDLLGPVRLALVAWGGPYVMENVPGAPLLGGQLICAGYFGQLTADCADGESRSLQRHRLFETNRLLQTPGCCCRPGEKIGVYGYGGRWHSRFESGRGGYKGCKSESSSAMGIDWMTLKELSQAIPPAYCEYIGRQLIRHL